MKVDFCSEMSRPGNDETFPLVGWRKPPPGSYKLNVDAAFFSDVKEARLGIVIRDSRGEVIWSIAKRVA